MTTLIRSNIFSFRKSFVAADILLYQKIKKIMKCNVTSTSDPHPLGLEANSRNSQLITFHSDLRSAAHSEHQLGEIKPIGQNSQMHSSYVHITAMHVSGRSSPRTKLCICYLWTHAAETRTKVFMKSTSKVVIYPGEVLSACPKSATFCGSLAQLVHPC